MRQCHVIITLFAQAALGEESVFLETRQSTHLSFEVVMSGLGFLQRLAPNGQKWSSYCASAPPAVDGEGRLVGAWGECMNSAVVFEKCNPNWQELPGFEDGPAGQVIEFCEQCGYGSYVSALDQAEQAMHEEMDSAVGDPFAFLQHRARNGKTWKEYCSRTEPFVDTNGFVNGAWGECLTAAVIFEHQNPAWDQLPNYMDDGPAGQVINFFMEMGHESHAGALERTEQASHEAFENGSQLPVFDLVYQAVPGTQEADEVGGDPPVMTGRKKALLVGNNYPGTKAQLNGCINDVHMWKENLIDLYGFDENEMVILTDDQSDERQRPTLANMRTGLTWLVAGAQPGDVLFFSFSGHGTQVKDRTGYEADGKNEALCPTDYSSSGFLVDDEIFDLIVTPLKSGVKLTIILDCCHSGTAVDLPFIWEKGEGRWATESGVPMSAGDVQMYSGCEDEQCSMDVTRHGRAGGAMTTAMTTVLRESPSLIYPELLDQLHRVLQERGMEQIPRLTSSQQFDASSKNFSLCDGAIPNQNPVLGIAGQPHHHDHQPNESFASTLLGLLF
eukprot:TRINITY_DN68813_c0_g1_i1.p1 TRINITY_DN68813_c0_g1~~TRINITY_DN68813_c0_g1_i1.p1  ORF type:complete len:558 (-),score=108.31 TRINITY_DN68813_c0_g1_i1:21-1694(-)